MSPRGDEARVFGNNLSALRNLSAISRRARGNQATRNELSPRVLATQSRSAGPQPLKLLSESGLASELRNAGDPLVVDDAGLKSSIVDERAMARTAAKLAMASAQEFAELVKSPDSDPVQAMDDTGIILRALDKRDANGSFVRRVASGLSRSKDKRHVVYQREEHTRDGWEKSRHEVVWRDGEHFMVRQTRGLFPSRGEPSAHDWKQVSTRTTVTIECDGQKLQRTEEMFDQGVSTRAIASYQPVSLKDARLPGDTRKAFRTGVPVLEETITYEPPGRSKRKSRMVLRRWHQENVRVEQRPGRDKNDAVTLEVARGKDRVEGQSFELGTARRMQFSTERLDDGSLRTEREWFCDDRGTRLPTKAARTSPLLKREVIHRWIDDEGILSRQTVELLDVTEEVKRFTEFNRTVAGGIETDSLAVRADQAGEQYEARIVQSVRQVRGQRELVELFIEDVDDTLNVSVNGDNCTLRYVQKPGGQETILPVPVDRKNRRIVLPIGKHVIEVGLDGAISGQESIVKVTEEDFESLPFAEKPADEALRRNLISLGRVPSPLLASLQYATVASAKVIGPLMILSAVRDTYHAASAAQAGNVLRAGIYGTKATAAFGRVAVTSPWIEGPMNALPVLGFIGGTADLVLGAESIINAKTRYGRLSGLAKIGVGVSTYGLVLDGPVPPMLAGIVLFEGVSAVSNYRGRRYAAKLSPSLYAEA